MGTTHTGIGYGAVKPSGRTVYHHGIHDVAFVHPGQHVNTDKMAPTDQFQPGPYTNQDTWPITDKESS